MKLKINILFIFFSCTILISMQVKSQTVNFGGSGWCQDDQNVNCDKWPPALDDRNRAVFLYSNTSISSSISYCTGTLINQITSDNQIQQYFISALHCIQADGTNDINTNFNTQFDFWFNYQSPDCDNTSMPTNPNVFRDGTAYHHQSLVTLIDYDNLTDVALFRIENPIPTHFNVYYMGWSKSFNQLTEYPHFVIHHPRRDIKKVAETWTTSTETDYLCHTITTVIDWIIGLFGGGTITETICTYVESPYYVIPAWATYTVTEHGSSGASLLNNNGRIFGILSGSFASCTLRSGDAFGRFNTTYLRSSAIRNALNPSGGYVLTGPPGRQITCPENLLNLHGNYYPASAYQSDNEITISANNQISSNGNLTIFNGADITFEAQEITLNPGFEVEEGAEFEATITSGCTSKSDSKQTDLLQEISKIEVPENKELDFSKFTKNSDFKSGEIDFFCTVYPQPAKNEINVNLAFSKTQSDVSVSIINVTGISIYFKTLQNVLNTTLQIEISQLTCGIYFLKIQTKDRVITKKILIEK